MRSRAPKRNAMLIEEAREKIRTTQIVNRLTNHVLGKVDMSSTQVTAALGLLRKAIPDLAAHQHSGEVNHNINNVADFLASIGRRSVAGVADGVPGQSDQVH